jgi:hypothetical protein
VLVPVSIDLLVSDRRRVFGYLAADSFYYLTVGRNFAEHGTLAFDQTHPTNGYHPLWQLVVAALFALARHAGLAEPSVLHAVVVLGALLAALAVLLFARIASSAGGPVGIGILTLPLGAYAVATSPLWLLPGGRPHPLEGDLPLYGTLWCAANGMETGLLLFAVALAARLFADDPLSSARRAACFGGTLAFVTLSRLDHGFFAVVLLAASLASAPRGHANRPFAAAVLAFAAPLALYLALNHALVGSALPVSGASKSSFPHPQGASLAPFVRLLRGKPPRLDTAIRQAQMLGPALVAMLVLVRRMRHRGRRDAFTDPLGRLLVALAGGTLLLASYNFLFVRPGNQWHWYYPVSTLFAGLVAARALDRMLPAGRRADLPLVVVVVALTIGVFLTLHRQPGYHRRYADFYYDEGPRVRAHYAGREPRLVCYDDGIVAFTTGFPTMSGFGLNLDVEASAALREARLLRLALDRGFDHVTSLVYATMSIPELADGSAAGARSYVRRLAHREDLSGWCFSTDYYSAPSRFAIVRVARKGSGAAPCRGREGESDRIDRP